MAKRLLIYSSKVLGIVGVSKDERTESGFTRRSPEQTRGKELETIESTKFIYIYRDEARQLWLKYVFMRGRGIRDGKEREWGRGATCSYNFDSLFPVPCLSLSRAGRRDDALRRTGERQKRPR